MGSPSNEDTNEPNVAAVNRTRFQPQNCVGASPDIQSPEELWLTTLESTCTFPPDIFSSVMLNLIKNPNVTSSHLFRADIFFDSDADRLHDCHDSSSNRSLVKHLKTEYQPKTYDLPGHELTRTIVRQLVPRNVQLDKPLVQTCHFFSKIDRDMEVSTIVYIPHVSSHEQMPFYHPAVARLAFQHTWPASDVPSSTPLAATISISYGLFSETTLTTKLERTALKLLQTVHKHGQGQLAGYEKRVHLDQIIPQKRYQDTYARLKAKYGKQLSEQWVEVTDPGKHVFEDIGIAAFLIELWRDMYSMPSDDTSGKALDVKHNGAASKPAFPGFVDIGCGNGILVYILLMEGYDGSGFDARERKTWQIFPDRIREKLSRRLLVPRPLIVAHTSAIESEMWHDGMFSPGTFIISNHADELTTWTPLLAYLNQSAFLAIPCCSHDFAGARFRAPARTKSSKHTVVRQPQQVTNDHLDYTDPTNVKGAPQAAETGSLKRTEAQKRMPSAYSTLCTYASSVAEEVGFEPEKEILRIPSTRNHGIVGRMSGGFEGSKDTLDKREQQVIALIEREMGRSNHTTGTEWIERANKLAKKPGSGH